MWQLNGKYNQVGVNTLFWMNFKYDYRNEITNDIQGVWIKNFPICSTTKDKIV